MATRTYREPAMTMKRNNLSLQRSSLNFSALFSLDMMIFVSGDTLNTSDWAEESRAANVVAILESRESVRLMRGLKSSGLVMAPDVVEGKILSEAGFADVVMLGEWQFAQEVLERTTSSSENGIHEFFIPLSTLEVKSPEGTSPCPEIGLPC